MLRTPNQRVERTATRRLVFDDFGNMNIDFQSWSALSVAAAHSGRSATMFVFAVRGFRRLWPVGHNSVSRDRSGSFMSSTRHPSIDGVPEETALECQSESHRSFGRRTPPPDLPVSTQNQSVEATAHPPRVQRSWNIPHSRRCQGAFTGCASLRRSTEMSHRLRTFMKLSPRGDNWVSGFSQDSCMSSTHYPSVEGVPDGTAVESQSQAHRSFGRLTPPPDLPVSTQNSQSRQQPTRRVS